MPEQPRRTTRPRRPATEQEAAALASAVRLRIIRLTFSRPLTNAEIAQRLGKDPATTLHHVRKLVDAGFLEALPVRRGTRGAREIPYRSTGLSWRLDHVAEKDMIAGAMLEAFLGEVADAGFSALRQTRLVLQVDEPQLAEFTDRLESLLEEFAARPAVSDGGRTAVYVALYPST
ncbi:MAG: ArsR/SmtB family transcription factor [Sciscionella sp.]